MMMYREIVLTRSDGELHFKYANEEDRKVLGNRNKIGGTPDWIQEPQELYCDSCAKPMVFYGQLDSIDDDSSLADAGMIYVFVCPECLNSKSIIQTY